MDSLSQASRLFATRASCSLSPCDDLQQSDNTFSRACACMCAQAREERGRERGRGRGRERGRESESKEKGERARRKGLCVCARAGTKRAFRDVQFFFCTALLSLVRSFRSKEKANTCVGAEARCGDVRLSGDCVGAEARCGDLLLCGDLLCARR
jgi:hypothetical protein